MARPGFKMNSKHVIIIYVLYVTNKMVNGAIPGLFFWKPRLGLDLSIPTTEINDEVNEPNKENIADGLVVMVDGYTAGMTIIGMASGLSNAEPYPHFNPKSAFFYTHVYRWALRYISLIPFWLGGNGGHFCDTLKVWRRRFYYMDEFVPSWLRTFLFYVKKEDWEKEQLDYRRFKKFAEPAFGKHYRYPGKVFNNFQSQHTVETVEEIPSSSLSV
ncbi:uncharacterized protein LOC113495746 [Trichoplusia ni]|uniref:Uncharacterized protein LOC113495746 n=1 Tax=Trichoplusia ni TaxID=7111 RepID=A0A7E5VQ55_TRINI|nr:uncharacterized protein LOC113495746 [Trichoplusia ni]